MIKECCSESRMRSWTSRGVPEWSRGKDLYMESCCSGSGKSSGFFGIVPGSFQKVPEDSGGVRRSGNCSTTSNIVAWAVRGRLSLNGPYGKGEKGPKGRPHPSPWTSPNWTREGGRPLPSFSFSLPFSYSNKERREFYSRQE